MSLRHHSQSGGTSRRRRARTRGGLGRCCAALLLLAAVLSACAPGPAAPLTPVILQLNWTHGAQFAGLYAAEQYGYYADEGLQVTFVEAGPTTDRIGPVVAGAAQLGLAGPPPLILARAAGQPVRAVAAVHQHTPFVFFALADSGITRPQHFAGKTVQIIPSALPFLHAVAARVGLAPEQYRVDTTAAGIAGLSDGSVDVASGFLTNEVLRASGAGHTLAIIYPDDYGVHFYGDVLFSSDDFIARNPDVVLRFLRATFKGWADIVESPARAGALVQRYKPEADPAWESSSVSASVPLIFTGQDPLGWMTPGTWEHITATLRDEHVLSAPLNPRELYTLRFLEELYGGLP